jgi:amidohydrolase
LACAFTRPSAARADGLDASLEALTPELDSLYVDLHAHPELSLQEAKTSARMAARLRNLDFLVKEKVGGYGVVGLLENGKGPTLLLRTDMDGLPIEEKTGLPYASREKAKDRQGQEVHVMHACGHDVHMTAWVGAATLLSRFKQRWRGTLLMVAQPAEEIGQGAKAMIEDGLFKRFPKPDMALALHTDANLAAGQVAVAGGFTFANVDSVDITLFGRGGHGGYPHKTVDPVVMAAQVVSALQTIVSRTQSPLEPSVVTVGSIHGGTKHNIIPDEVRMQLSLRSYGPESRRALRKGVERIVVGTAQSAGAPRQPALRFAEGTHAVYNDPTLAKKIAKALEQGFPKGQVHEQEKTMAAEDFGAYGRLGKFPAVIMRLGTVDPGRLAEAQARGDDLPSLHSPLFAPDKGRSLSAGARALTLAVMALLPP